MSALREAMSHAALGWVKPELDETLRQVRNEVEYFVEDPADTSRMRFCAGFLHQVQGTLRMVELYAPAMVAEELEQLALAVGQGQVTDRDEACATLMRGTVLLPDYLERLQNGHRDIPIVLLPLLNEIRAARGASGINESVLFAFAPDSASASAEELEHARGSLSGRNRELLDTVGNVVKEELLRIKDALDLHLRTGGEPTALQAQISELGAVADTLGVMGLGAARGVVVQQANMLRGVVDAGKQIDEGMLLDIAGALLYVDASLDDQVAHLGAAGSGEDDPSSSESRRTVEVLAHEAIANFTNAREQFVAFIETNWDHTRLADVPRLLGDVAGALRILDLATPADYLEGVRRYILVELIGRQRVPSGRQLDTLADAMASLEYYLEALRDRRPGREEILDITRTSLEALRYWPLPPLDALDDSRDASPVADVAPAVAAAAAASAPLPPSVPAFGAEPVIEPVAPVQPEAPAIAEHVDAVEPPAAPAIEPAPSVPVPPPLPQAVIEPAAPQTPARPLVFEASVRPFEGNAPAWEIHRPTAPATAAPSSAFDPVLAETPDQAEPDWSLAPIALDGVETAPVASDDTRAAADNPFDPVHAEVGELELVDEPIAFSGHSDIVIADDVLSLPLDTDQSIDFVVYDDIAVDEVVDDVAAAPQAYTPSALADGPLQDAEAVSVQIDVVEPLAEVVEQDAFVVTDAAVLDVVEAPLAEVVTSHDDHSLVAQDDVQVELQDDEQDAPSIADLSAQLDSAPAVAVQEGSINRIELDDEATAFLAALDQAAAEFDPIAAQAPAASSSEPVADIVAADAAVDGIDAGFQDDGEAVDDDIREVFIEEFDEELVNLGQLLPAWRAAPDNVERLRPIRRVFHTLKGSGRLVGARALGEFSWKIESMLNRVLDGSRPASPAVVAMVTQAYEVLPQLNAALRDGTRVHADLDGMQAIAERIAAGEETFHIPGATTTPAPVADEAHVAAPGAVDVESAFAAAPAAPAPLDGTPASVDSVLLEILEAEVETHQRTFQRWLDAAAAALPATVDDALLRAVHTMNGAFAMTDVPEITAVTGAAERFIKRSLAAGIPAEAGGVAALGETSRAIDLTVTLLQGEQPRIPSFAGLAQRLQALAEALPEASWQALHPVDDEMGVDAPEADASVDVPAVELGMHDAGLDGLVVDDLDKADDLSKYFDAGLLDAQVAQDAQPTAQASDDTYSLELADVEVADVPVEPVDTIDWTATSLDTTSIDAIDSGMVDAVEPGIALVDEQHSGLDAIVRDTVDADTNADAGIAVVEADSHDGELIELLEDAAEQPAFGDAVTLEQVEAEGLSIIETDALRSDEPAFAVESAVDDGLDADADAATDAVPASGYFEMEEPVAVQPIDDVASSDAAVDATAAEFETTAVADASDVGDSEPAMDVVDTIEAAQTQADAVEEPVLAAAEPVVDEQQEEPEPEAEPLGQPLDFNTLDLELVDIFVEEGKDLLDHCDGLISELREAPEDRDVLGGLQRDLHTLKGGARMAGINAIGDLSHAIESLLEAVAANKTTLGIADIRLLERGFDRLHRKLLRTGEHRTIGMPVELIAAFEQRTEGHPVELDGVAVGAAVEAAADTAAASAQVLDVQSMAVDPVALVAEDAVVQDVVDVGTSSEPEAAPVDDVQTPVVAEAPAVPEPAQTVETVIDTPAVAQQQDSAPAVAPVAAAPAQAPAPVAMPAPLSAVASAPLSAPVPLETTEDEEGVPRVQQEQVRVRADLLDRLVNHAGEVAIYRSRLEQQLGAFRGAMAELDRTNARLRDQLRRLDLETEAQIVARYQREQDQADQAFDPLELDRFSTLQQLSRALNESAADLGGLQGVLDDLARQYDSLLQQQSRVSSELQDGLMRARMVPFDGLVPRLRRVVRQAGMDTGKQVHLTLEGTHGELDRNVLDRMVAPLEHMLRNSVAHGLELPAQRRSASKHEEGEVAIRLRREGSEIVLEVSDDGAGLDREAIRRRAEQRGLIAAGANLSDSELDSLIFAAGFSTADQVSQLAGRGVGMDVVRNEVRQLGGTVDIQSVRGQGTCFTLRLPQTLAVTQAVFVKIGETTFAVPVASVSGIGRISRERFESGDGGYNYSGEHYTLHDLGTLVGQDAAKAEGLEQVPLLLVRAGDLRAAVAIDAVVGNREIVVKPVGMQIASVPGIYGATITGDGQVVVILDVAPLVRRHLAQPQRAVPAAPAAAARHVPLVMVVDDSLTMRKVTGRILERHNFEVSVARDGIEALERLEERVPDLMLLDIEMPRMDGYELATTMRADPRYKHVPIVMITSRSGDKHRQRAFEIGVQRYLGKPYQELDLMRNVYDLLGIARVRE